MIVNQLGNSAAIFLGKPAK